MSSQLPLDFTRGPRARRGDPETSQKAALRASRFDKGHYALILAALMQGPANFKVIADRCGLDKHAVARRLPELQDGAKVVPTEVVVDGARVWRLP